MDYDQAMQCLRDGKCVYRAGWDADKFLVLHCGRVRLRRKHRIMGMYIFTAEDLTAHDWEQEYFVLPA